MVLVLQLELTDALPLVDPHLQIRRGERGRHHPNPEIRGRGTVSPKIFPGVWATVWSKNKGPSLDLPLFTGHQNMS